MRYSVHVLLKMSVASVFFCACLILGTENAQAQEDFIVTVGENKQFLDYNVWDTYEEGSSTLAESDGKRGVAQVWGYTQDTQDAVATAGVHFQVTGSDTANIPQATIYITFDYHVEAKIERLPSSPWEECYGHAQTLLNVVFDGDREPVDDGNIDFLLSCGEDSESGSMTLSYTVDTSSDTGHSLFLEAKAHTGGIPDGYYESFARIEVTVERIFVDFGNCGIKMVDELWYFCGASNPGPNPFLYTTHTLLVANGMNEEGIFVWKILEGSDKVQFRHNESDTITVENSNSVTIESIDRSQKRKDVLVALAYDDGMGNTQVCQHTTEVRAPYGLRHLSWLDRDRPLGADRRPGYSSKVFYQLLNNFNEPVKRIWIVEKFPYWWTAPFSGDPWWNLPLNRLTGGQKTNIRGIFSDEMVIRPYAALWLEPNPVHPDHESAGERMVTIPQWIWVGDCPVQINDQVYYRGYGRHERIVSPVPDALWP